MNATQWLFAVFAILASMAATLSICRPLLGAKPAFRWRIVAPVAAGMPLLATLLYGHLGAPRILAVEPIAVAHRLNDLDMEEATARLAERLGRAPSDLDGWIVLARSHQALGNWQAAAQAYRQALGLVPDDPRLMSDLADVLANMQAGSLEGEPAALIERALRIDPRNAKGHALAAMAAYRQARFSQAKLHWRQLALLSPSGSEGAELARQGLARLEVPDAGSRSAGPDARPALR